MKKTLSITLIISGLIVMMILIFFSQFPIKYKDIANFYAKEYNVPLYMIMSVINIESGFKKTEVSNAGAIGLMQLMPATAVDMSDRLGVNVDKEDLFDENINIMLGTFYIAYLLNMFDGNVTNALCAYNWGLNNVKSEILVGNVNADGTIGNIPVAETKTYIKKYKLSQFIYQNIYGYK